MWSTRLQVQGSRRKPIVLLLLARNAIYAIL